ncbi:MAG TPA: nicotinate-nucleotide adenylyltransferase [Chthoniobacterales bacterium]|nr:nicotinate-nucleotide adenylyltransferase [Chthoniobacterales bacterium]
MKKIGIYGGTFDPIHHAHLILGRQTCEQLGLDRLIFVPAAVSPFKSPAFASGEQRLSMLRAAIAGQQDFAADDCELKRPPPSYSIDTVLEIRERDPKAELFWLIGADNVSGLNKWHRIDELKKLVQFVVLDRGRAGKTAHQYPVVQRNIDISATEIRKRVASGRSIRYLVPKAVEEIIRRENLYRESGT